MKLCKKKAQAIDKNSVLSRFTRLNQKQIENFGL